jgi:hypothetical protein
MDIAGYRMLAGILKSEWVRRIAEPHMAGQTSGQPSDAPFAPDAAAIRQALKARGGEWNLDAEGGCQPENLDLLITEMIAAGIHRAGPDSPELEAFAARDAKTRNLLAGGELEQEREYHLARSLWLQNHNAMGDLLLMLEQVRLKNAHIRWEFLVRFGDDYLALKEASARHDRLRLMIDLREAMPLLSDEAIEKMADEAEQDIRRRLALLRLDVLLAPALAKPRGSGSSAMIKDLGQCRRESKRILREIWMLLHPDRLQRHEKFQALTEAQKETLQHLWSRTMEVTPEEVGYREEQMGYQYRPLMVLETILADARAILEHAGIDVDVRTLIQGNTLEERIVWLKSDMARQGGEIESIRAEIKALMESRDAVHHRSVLNASPEQQEIIRKEMRERTRRLRQEAEDMEARLAAMRKTSPRESKQ